MLKRRLTSLVLILLILAPAAVQAAENIDKSQPDKGVISINYKPAQSIPFKCCFNCGHAERWAGVFGSKTVLRAKIRERVY